MLDRRDPSLRSGF